MLCTFFVVLRSPQTKTTVNKNTHFFGQSVFGQLISLIHSKIVSRNSNKHNADHCVKKFATKDHLTSMLFGVFAKCVSGDFRRNARIIRQNKTFPIAKPS